MTGVTIMIIIVDEIKISDPRYGVFSEVGKYLDWISENFNMLPPDDFVYL